MKLSKSIFALIVTVLTSNFVLASEYPVKCEFNEGGIYHQILTTLEGDLGAQEERGIDYGRYLSLITEHYLSAQFMEIDNRGGDSAESRDSFIEEYSLGTGHTIVLHPTTHFSKSGWNELTKSNTYSFLEMAAVPSHSYDPSYFLNGTEVTTFLGDSRFNTAGALFDVADGNTYDSPEQLVKVAHDRTLIIHMQKKHGYLKGRGFISKGLYSLDEVLLGNHLGIEPTTEVFECTVVK